MKSYRAHILVVDDDNGIRNLVKKFLIDNNYLVNTAANAVKRKSASNPVVKTTVVKPSEKTVVNNIPDNSTNENLAIKTSPKPSAKLKNSSIIEENKPIEKGTNWICGSPDTKDFPMNGLYQA